MDFGIDFLGCEYFLDDAVFVDEEGRSEDTHVGTSVHFLFAPYTESLGKAFVGVGNETEGQLLLGDEAKV